jgi:hypothetical protein
MFAENKEKAFSEMSQRFGDSATQYSLIAYVPVEKFALFIN